MCWSGASVAFESSLDHVGRPSPRARTCPRAHTARPPRAAHVLLTKLRLSLSPSLPSFSTACACASLWRLSGSRAAVPPATRTWRRWPRLCPRSSLRWCSEPTQQPDSPRGPIHPQWPGAWFHACGVPLKRRRGRADVLRVRVLGGAAPGAAPAAAAASERPRGAGVGVLAPMHLTYFVCT